MTSVLPNRREAVYASLRFKQQEPCPYYVWIDDMLENNGNSV